MKTFIRLSSFVLAASMLAGCAVNPPYAFTKEEKTATLKMLNMGRATMCRDGALYNVTVEEGKKDALLPAGQRVSIGTFMQYSGYNVTYSCYPFISFVPKEGVTYVLHNGLRSDRCFVEVVREDNNVETGVSIEPSVGPRDCFKK